MQRSILAAISDVLLQDYQRDFPLVSEPYAKIAADVNASEDQVIAACKALIDRGVVARIGGVVRPNTIAASTLAAVSVPEFALDHVAALISELEGVNHVYSRENATNIWFVATGPDRAYVDATLRKVEQLSGEPVLDLRLERSFHIDLGFPLDGHSQARRRDDDYVPYHAGPYDRHLLQILSSGLALQTRPFQIAAENLQISETDVIGRLQHLSQSGVVTRMGAIIRHRALGWRSNAMVVWDLPAEDIEERARILAAQDGINLCYQRRRYETQWPYNLYCMIHAKTRDDALRMLECAGRLAGLDDVPRQILFSSRCYKQTGALIVSAKEAA